MDEELACVKTPLGWTVFGKIDRTKADELSDAEAGHIACMLSSTRARSIAATKGWFQSFTFSPDEPPNCNEESQGPTIGPDIEGDQTGKEEGVHVLYCIVFIPCNAPYGALSRAQSHLCT